MGNAMTVVWLTEDGKRPPRRTLAEVGYNPLRWWGANVIAPIHKGRIPLSGPSFYAACVFYAMIPLVGGYYVMQWSMKRSEENIGVGGQKLHKTQNTDREVLLRKQTSALAEVLQ